MQASEMPPKIDGIKLLKGDRIIEGIKVVPLRRIPDERGTIYQMLKVTDPYFSQFGEIYFSTVYPGIIKGWHRHREMTLHYACISGSIKLVLYDDRKNSPTEGNLMEIFLGPDNYSLVIIPPDIWNGFKGLSYPFAMVANCSSHPHDPSRSTRLDPLNNNIPYDWSAKHE